MQQGRADPDVGVRSAVFVVGRPAGTVAGVVKPRMPAGPFAGRTPFHNAKKARGPGEFPLNLFADSVVLEEDPDP